MINPVKPPSATPARLPNFVEPMKAKLVGAMPSGGDWIYEIKFDGYRAVALRDGSETRLLSRNKKDLGKKFPAIAGSIAKLDVLDAIIDGEIVALGRERTVVVSAAPRIRYGPGEAANLFLWVRLAQAQR